jgi:hypothetical protein
LLHDKDVPGSNSDVKVRAPTASITPQYIKHSEQCLNTVDAAPVFVESVSPVRKLRSREVQLKVTQQVPRGTVLLPSSDLII